LGRGDLDRAASLLREAVNLFLEMGNEGGTLMGLCNLANALHRKGDVNGAELLLQAVLKRELALEREYETVDVLLGLADIALARRQVRRAALLLGAIEAMSQSIGYARYGWSRDAFERIADSTRSVLGEDDFATLWRHGTQLTVSEAAAEALGASDGWVSSASSTDEANPATLNVRLTSREQDVLQLLAEGHSDRQIAAALSISPKTAGNHVSRILAKLNVETRTAAATLAVRRGLV
jgi:DNA-binding CsgD family transcriptional regulator